MPTVPDERFALVVRRLESPCLRRRDRRTVLSYFTRISLSMTADVVGFLASSGRGVGTTTVRT